MGLLALMALLYVGGALINPAFFGTTDALHALLRDSARYGVMAVGMTFVIVNKDIDLSVGSTLRARRRSSSRLFSRRPITTTGLATALLSALFLGTVIGLINGVLVTILRVPAFIATLTMLLIGRGMVLGLTGGKNIAYPAKAAGIRCLLPDQRDERLRLQQPDRDLPGGCCRGRDRACQDPLGL